MNITCILSCDLEGSKVSATVSCPGGGGVVVGGEEGVEGTGETLYCLTKLAVKLI